MTQPLLIDVTLLDAVSAAAQNGPRQRQNYNFHPDDRAACHRLINAIEPDSYIPPHRHNDPAKSESILVLRGRLGAVFFNDQGEVTLSTVLEPDSPVVGINIPAGVFHTLLALVPGTVCFETKAGPYLPLAPDERASWAPTEGEGEAAGYREQLRSRFAPTPPTISADESA